MQNTSAAVIVAAGSSRRMAGHDKLWLPLAGRVVLAHTIAVFEASPLIDTIVLVLHAERLEDGRTLCRQEGWQKVTSMVAGGPLRQDSVRIGLDMLAATAPDTRRVMIHDGARPFVTHDIIQAGLLAVQEYQAAVAAVPAKDTIKRVLQGQVYATLDRSQLWSIQTPQIFWFPLIHEAHRALAGQEDITDDAALLERLGKRVTIFPGSYGNIKITTQEDLLFAETLLQGRVLP